MRRAKIDKAEIPRRAKKMNERHKRSYESNLVSVGEASGPSEGAHTDHETSVYVKNRIKSIQGVVKKATPGKGKETDAKRRSATPKRTKSSLTRSSSATSNRKSSGGSDGSSSKGSGIKKSASRNSSLSSSSRKGNGVKSGASKNANRTDTPKRRSAVESSSKTGPKGVLQDYLASKSPTKTGPKGVLRDYQLQSQKLKATGPKTGTPKAAARGRKAVPIAGARARAARPQDPEELRAANNEEDEEEEEVEDVAVAHAPPARSAISFRSKGGESSDMLVDSESDSMTEYSFVTKPRKLLRPKSADIPEDLPMTFSDEKLSQSGSTTDVASNRRGAGNEQRRDDDDDPTESEIDIPNDEEQEVLQRTSSSQEREEPRIMEYLQSHESDLGPYQQVEEKMKHFEPYADGSDQAYAYDKTTAMALAPWRREKYARMTDDRIIQMTRNELLMELKNTIIENVLLEHQLERSRRDAREGIAELEASQQIPVDGGTERSTAVSFQKEEVHEKCNLRVQALVDKVKSMASKHSFEKHELQEKVMLYEYRMLELQCDYETKLSEITVQFNSQIDALKKSIESSDNVSTHLSSDLEMSRTGTLDRETRNKLSSLRHRIDELKQQSLDARKRSAELKKAQKEAEQAAQRSRRLLLARELNPDGSQRSQSRGSDNSDSEDKPAKKKKMYLSRFLERIDEKDGSKSGSLDGTLTSLDGTLDFSRPNRKSSIETMKKRTPVRQKGGDRDRSYGPDDANAPPLPFWGSPFQSEVSGTDSESRPSTMRVISGSSDRSSGRTQSANQARGRDKDGYSSTTGVTGVTSTTDERAPSPPQWNDAVPYGSRVEDEEEEDERRFLQEVLGGSGGPWKDAINRRFGLD